MEKFLARHTSFPEKSMATRPGGVLRPATAIYRIETSSASRHIEKKSEVVGTNRAPCLRLATEARHPGCLAPVSVATRGLMRATPMQRHQPPFVHTQMSRTAKAICNVRVL